MMTTRDDESQQKKYPIKTARTQKPNTKTRKLKLQAHHRNVYYAMETLGIHEKYLKHTLPTRRKNWFESVF